MTADRIKKTELCKKLDLTETKYCFNNQVYSDEKLKFIIVGDNPGKTEYEQNKFFVGSSG
jgi:uracil-DNA glycosylase